MIGGGDWASDRIVPDAIRALSEKQVIEVRNPQATRPWQHVLEPLSGYLLLAERMFGETEMNNRYTDSFNFGPSLDSNRTVKDLVEEMTKYWEGTWQDVSGSHEPHEAHRLHLQIDKAYNQLGWSPRWDFETTVERTMNWYKDVDGGGRSIEICLADIAAYQAPLDQANVSAI